jgi:3-isopropylmalate/(R)-2-methylmalate dehydratase small subunit
MTPFTRLTAIAAPLLRDNIDTDAIIPSREMRTVSKKGLAEGMFAGWRYSELGSRDPNPDFVLNQARYRDVRILVAGRNFGCGSSREHAVWALVEYGIQVVIAPSFNPIFLGNCIANGMLPACVPPEQILEIVTALDGLERPILTVDLEARRISTGEAPAWHFSIDDEARKMLLAGTDTIGLALQHAAEITAFRKADAIARPWIYGDGRLG